MAISKLAQQIDQLQQMSKKEIRVGWFPENVYPDGTPVALVMFWNEFGTPNAKHPIPPRPLFRQAAEKVNQKMNGFVVRRVKDVLDGKMTADQVPGVLAEAILGTVVTEFKVGGFTPNADSTVRGKGFNSPLVDTGHAAQSVQYKIEDKK